MPPTMARPRTFSKSKQQKGEPLAKSQTSRDTDWNVGNYMNMPGKNRRGLKKKESNQGKSESTALTALNSSMNSGATRIKKDTSSSQELDKGSKDSKEQENKKKIVLSDEAINQMITISNLMTEVKDSIHENIKEINNHEDTLLELEYSANNLERICSNSQLIWKIDDFRHKYSEAVSGKNSTLYSAPFETHKYGYKLALSFCPFGDGRAKGKYASLFFCVLRTDYDALLPWPFAHKLTFSIIDQREIPPYTPANKIQREDYVMEFTPNPIKENQPFVGRPTGFRNSSLGLPRFIPIDQLRNEKYLIDDAIYIRVQIHLDNVPKL